MPQSANHQRNNAYYYNANGSTSPALPNPVLSVADCQAWGAANGLNVVGIEYIGECYGCYNCNYAVDGAVSPNCTAPPGSLGCSYNIKIYTLSSPQTRGLALGNSSTTDAPASTAGSSLASTPVSSTPQSLWIAVATVGAATVAAAAAIGARVYRRRRAARAGGGDAAGGKAAPTKIPITELPSRLTVAEDA